MQCFQDGNKPKVQQDSKNRDHCKQITSLTTDEMCLQDSLKERVSSQCCRTEVDSMTLPCHSNTAGGNAHTELSIIFLMHVKSFFLIQDGSVETCLIMQQENSDFSLTWT